MPKFGGYNFIGWTSPDINSGAVMQGGDTFTMPAKNIVFTAQWDLVTRTYVEVDMVISDTTSQGVVALDIKPLGMSNLIPGVAYVDYGDGSIDAFNPGSNVIASHSFPVAGTYRVKIYDIDDSISGVRFRAVQGVDITNNGTDPEVFPVQLCYAMKTMRTCTIEHQTGGLVVDSWQFPFSQIFAYCGNSPIGGYPGLFQGFANPSTFSIEAHNMADSGTSWTDKCDISFMFQFSSIQAIPPNLLKGMAPNRYLYIRRMFFKCPNITSIPPLLFSSCTPYYATELFQETNVTTLPAQLFTAMTPNWNNQTPVARGFCNLTRAFHLVGTLSTIEEGALDGICSPAAANDGHISGWGGVGISLDGMFYWNHGLNTVPEGLFDNLVIGGWNNTYGWNISLNGTLCRCTALNMDINDIFQRSSYPEIVQLGNSENASVFASNASGIFSGSQYGAYTFSNTTNTTDEPGVSKWRWTSQADTMIISGDVNAFIAKFPNIQIPSNGNMAFRVPWGPINVYLNDSSTANFAPLNASQWMPNINTVNGGWATIPSDWK